MNHPGRPKNIPNPPKLKRGGRRKGLGDNDIKMSILLYLMDGPKWRTDITEYILKTYHLKNRTCIDRHLRDMTIGDITETHNTKNPNVKNLIDKYEDSDKIYYRLIPKENLINDKEIDRFVKIFNVADETKKIKELMQTPYAKMIITSKSFVPCIARTLSDIVYPFEVIHFLLDNGYTIEQIERDILIPDPNEKEIDSGETDKQNQFMLSILNELRANDRIHSIIVQSVANNKYSQLREKFRPHRKRPDVINIINAINNVLEEWGIELFVARKGELFGETRMSPQHLIPIRERDAITKFIQISPSALKFVLNLKELDITKSMLMLIPYCDYTDRVINTVYDAIKDTDILNPVNTPEICSKLVRDALVKLEQSFHSPLYKILESLSISDIQHGDIVKNEGFWEFYKSLFNEPLEESK